MKIFIAADHAGYKMKGELIPWLENLGHEVKDLGAYEYDEQDDYPDFMTPVTREVSKDSNARGILIGGSGQGEVMLANRYRNVRAAVYQSPNLDIIKFARLHNNANVLCIGARFITSDQAQQAIKLFLEAPFSQDPKYQRRIDKTERERE